MRIQLRRQLPIHNVREFEACHFQAALLERELRKVGFTKARHVFGYASWRLNAKDPQAYVLCDTRSITDDHIPVHGWVDLGGGWFIDPSAYTFQEKLEDTTYPGEPVPDLEMKLDYILARYDHCVSPGQVKSSERICFNYERCSNPEFACMPRHVLEQVQKADEILRYQQVNSHW